MTSIDISEIDRVAYELGYFVINTIGEFLKFQTIFNIYWTMW